MAVVSFNKKQFEKEIGKLDEKLQNKIAMFGTPVEEVNDKDIQIEVFPNRPDLLSYHGFKRAFLGFLGKKTGLINYKVNPPEKDYKVTVESSLKDIRPYTACAIIRDLKFDDNKIKEIIEIQEKLHSTLGRKRKKIAIGIYPIESIKLPIIFKALEPDKIKFIPLESEKEMSGLEILQKNSVGKEYAHLLKGKTKFPVFVDSSNQILSMPPIINSQSAGKITEKTNNIFIECSGNDFQILNKCLNILVTSFSDMGGKIYQIELKHFENKTNKKLTPDFQTETMNISLENTNKLLGLNLTEKQLKQLIEKMGYNYSKGKVKVPSWRTDILHEVDLIEDIAIAYGYENFIPEIPEIPMIGSENQKEILKRKISEIFVGLGMLELSNYHLTINDDQFKKMGIKHEEVIVVDGSKTEYTILRRDLTHYLLKILSENIDSEYPQKIFEIGKIFEIKNENIVEKEKFSLAISPGNFTDVKQTIEYFSKMIGLNFEIKTPNNFPNYFIDGRVAEISFNEKKVGFIGEIHPRILKNWKIKMPVAIFEISLEEIFEKFKD